MRTYITARQRLALRVLLAAQDWRTLTRTDPYRLEAVFAGALEKAGILVSPSPDHDRLQHVDATLMQQEAGYYEAGGYSLDALREDYRFAAEADEETLRKIADRAAELLGEALCEAGLWRHHLERAVAEAGFRTERAGEEEVTL